jgi:hypothetical protein
LLKEHRTECGRAVYYTDEPEEAENLAATVCEDINRQLDRLKYERDMYKTALEKIADPRLLHHSQLNSDAYNQLGCVMNIAKDTLNFVDPKNFVL